MKSTWVLLLLPPSALKSSSSNPSQPAMQLR